MPCAVVATTGTTTTTALDPIAAIAAIARQARPLAARRCGDGRLGDDPARVPVDVGRHRRRRLDRRQPAQVARRGVRLLASTTCAMPDELVRVMSTNPSYLQTAADAVVKNFRDWGLPLGRRFRALKLWFLIREQGVARPAGAPAPRPRQRPVARRAQSRGTPGWRVLRRWCCRRSACGTNRRA